MKGKNLKYFMGVEEPEVTTINSLDRKGENGEIYYNTSDGQYYLYNNGYSQIGQDVIITDELPERGMEGRLYYNPDNSTYSTFNTVSGEWEIIATKNKVISNINDVEPLVRYGTGNNVVGYILEPNTFYNIMTNWEMSGCTINDCTLFFDTSDENVYAGRFTITEDSPNIIWPTGTIYPDSNPELENGHTYEFNVYLGVCLITDITYTQP